ncbi:hypothetical protein [Crocosphaera chwakensis]|uniref:Uncharacterized protein n=1 Tax=Crocosphaera chwakensis CCY0110 TaxID=391612 RepID=A3IUG4_9CHRO|nr:hypothetical protein [Crocosphaera chwakensis]EAZ89851.1 hypothetical protein CY0110_06184 [Crocosphaera chwakensis CCY0110]
MEPLTLSIILLSATLGVTIWDLGSKIKKASDKDRETVRNMRDYIQQQKKTAIPDVATEANKDKETVTLTKPLVGFFQDEDVIMKENKDKETVTGFQLDALVANAMIRKNKQRNLLKAIGLYDMSLCQIQRILPDRETIIKNPYLVNQSDLFPASFTPQQIVVILKEELDNIRSNQVTKQSYTSHTKYNSETEKAFEKVIKYLEETIDDETIERTSSR